jgi:hypothetical protein
MILIRFSTNLETILPCRQFETKLRSDPLLRLNLNLSTEYFRQLLADAEAEPMPLRIHATTVWVPTFKKRHKQPLQIFLTDAETFILHMYAVLVASVVKSDHNLRLWIRKLNRILDQVDEYLLNANPI